MEQSIHEWTKYNLWNTAFQKFYIVHSWILYPMYQWLSYLKFVKNWEKKKEKKHYYFLTNSVMNILASQANICSRLQTKGLD